MTLLNYYKIPSEIPRNVCDEIINQYYINDQLEEGYVEQQSDIIRSSKVNWIHNDNWVAGMMSHFALCANKNYFKFDLDGWRYKIQFTVYDKKNDHYNWHIDVSSKDLEQKFVRKLSMIMCLSSKDDYEGGEFEIDCPSSTMKETIKLDCGEVIVFPSILQHRVRPIKSGKRFSLVGWMGGPPFK